MLPRAKKLKRTPAYRYRSIAYEFKYARDDANPLASKYFNYAMKTASRVPRDTITYLCERATI